MNSVTIKSALTGVRVLEFTHVIAGPFAGLQLRQMGAAVTKVEPPQGGDYLQSLANGQRVYTALNGDKTVLRLDLKTEPGLSRVLEEAARSDVLIDSYRPGVLTRLGLDYTHLNSMNPRLIYCSISGYGSQNPRWAKRGAYDHVIQAMTGMAMQSGRPGDAPVKVGFPLVDNGTALVAVNAILAALFERMRTGRGQYLEVSMWRAALQLMYTNATDCLNTGTDAPRVGNVGYTGSPGARFVACRDGWVAVGANTPAQMANLFLATGVSLKGDGDPAAADVTAFVADLKRHFATLCADEAEQCLLAHEVPASKVRTLHEFLALAQEQELLTPVELRGEPAVKTVGPGWRSFAAAQPEAESPAPHHRDSGEIHDRSDIRPQT